MSLSTYASKFASRFLKSPFSSTLKPVSDQVIVITGASSGIGLATALSAAKKGARLVLASRNEKSLAEAQRKIEDLGAEAVYVVADVSNAEEVQQIANTAIATFGGFDTWVNCAGVSMIGKIEEISDEDNRRLFETNFWGIVYGSQIAAAHLKYKGGSIINLGSLVSDMAIPMQGMYSASKHAVKGFTDAFRTELEADKARVSMTLIKPAAIATPFFEHAKNYTHQEVKAPPPVYAPEEVAYAILHAASNRVRDIRVGGAGFVMAGAHAHAPRVMDWVNEKFMIDSQFADAPKSRHKNNLHEAGPDGEIYGRDMPPAMSSIYTRASLHPVTTGIVLTAVSVAAYKLLGNKGRVGKAALTGLNLLMPVQNALIAKNIQRLFDGKKHDMLSRADTMFDHMRHSIKEGVKGNIKAVNENANTMKKKTLKLLN